MSASVWQLGALVHRAAAGAAADNNDDDELGEALSPWQALAGIVAIDAAEWVGKHAKARYLRRRGPRSAHFDALPVDAARAGTVNYAAFLATRTYWSQLRVTAATAASEERNGAADPATSFDFGDVANSTTSSVDDGPSGASSPRRRRQIDPAAMLPMRPHGGGVTGHGGASTASGDGGGAVDDDDETSPRSARRSGTSSPSGQSSPAQPQLASRASSQMLVRSATLSRVRGGITSSVVSGSPSRSRARGQPRPGGGGERTGGPGAGGGGAVDMDSSRDRRAALRDPRLDAALDAVWRALPKDRRGEATKAGYIDAAVALLARIAPDIARGPLMAYGVAAAEWGTVLDGLFDETLASTEARRSVAHRPCVERLRHKCDAWCETASVAEVVEFAELMLEAAREACPPPAPTGPHRRHNNCDNTVSAELDDDDTPLLPVHAIRIVTGDEPTLAPLAAAGALGTDSEHAGAGFIMGVAELTSLRLGNAGVRAEGIDRTGGGALSSYCALLSGDGVAPASANQHLRSTTHDGRSSSSPSARRHHHSGRSQATPPADARPQSPQQVRASAIEAAAIFGVTLRGPTGVGEAPGSSPPPSGNLREAALAGAGSVRFHHSLKGDESRSPTSALGANSPNFGVLSSANRASGGDSGGGDGGTRRRRSSVGRRSSRGGGAPAARGDGGTGRAPPPAASHGYLPLLAVPAPEELVDALTGNGDDDEDSVGGGTAWASFGGLQKSVEVEALPSGIGFGNSKAPSRGKSLAWASTRMLRARAPLRTIGQRTVYNPIRLRAARCPVQYAFVWSLNPPTGGGSSSAAAAAFAMGPEVSERLTKLWLLSDPAKVTAEVPLDRLPPAVHAALLSFLPAGGGDAKQHDNLKVVFDVADFAVRIVTRAKNHTFRRLVSRLRGISGDLGEAAVGGASSQPTTAAAAGDGDAAGKATAVVELPLTARYEAVWEYANRTGTAWIALPSASQRLLTRWIASLRDSIVGASMASETVRSGADVISDTAQQLASPAVRARRKSAVHSLQLIAHAARTGAGHHGTVLRTRVEGAGEAALFGIEGTGTEEGSTHHIVDIGRWSMTSWCGGRSTERRLRCRIVELGPLSPNAPRSSRVPWLGPMIRLFRALEASFEGHDHHIDADGATRLVKAVVDASRQGKRSRWGGGGPDGTDDVDWGALDDDDDDDDDEEDSDPTAAGAAGTTRGGVASAPSRRDVDFDQADRDGQRAMELFKLQQRALGATNAGGQIGAPEPTAGPNSIVMGPKLRRKLNDRQGHGAEDPDLVGDHGDDTVQPSQRDQPTQLHAEALHERRQPVGSAATKMARPTLRPKDLIRIVGSPADPEQRREASRVSLHDPNPSLLVRELVRKGGMAMTAPAAGRGNGVVPSVATTDPSVELFPATSAEGRASPSLPVRDTHVLAPETVSHRRAGSRTMSVRDGRRVALGGGARASMDHSRLGRARGGPPPDESDDDGDVLELRSRMPLMHAVDAAAANEQAAAEHLLFSMDRVARTPQPSRVAQTLATPSVRRSATPTAIGAVVRDAARPPSAALVTPPAATTTAVRDVAVRPAVGGVRVGTPAGLSPQPNRQLRRPLTKGALPSPSRRVLTGAGSLKSAESLLQLDAVPVANRRLLATPSSLMQPAMDL